MAQIGDFLFWFGEGVGRNLIDLFFFWDDTKGAAHQRRGAGCGRVLLKYLRKVYKSLEIVFKKFWEKGCREEGKGIAKLEPLEMKL